LLERDAQESADIVVVLDQEDPHAIERPRQGHWNEHTIRPLASLDDLERCSGQADPRSQRAARGV
jgi:hypothetical protein